MNGSSQANQTPEARKQASIARLKAAGIPYIEHLPCIESASEVRVRSNEGGEQDVVNMVWKYEAYWVLLWALGVVEELDFPDHAIDCDFAIQAVAQHQDFAAFMATTKLRDIASILDEADLIYRYHWACVNARLKQAPMPAGLNPSVVMERHAALNWLIDNDGQDDWDNPDVST